MAAATLPTELLQLVYRFLDPPDFFSARRVCKWWRHTSDNTTVLHKQLDLLPVVQPCDPTLRQDLSWFRLVFNKVAYSHMMGMQLEKSSSIELAYARKINKSKFAVSGDGSRLAALDSGLMTVHNTTDDFRIVHAQPTNSYKWMLGPGPWFKSAPNACFELGISADTSVVAIALERTVQIYELSSLAPIPISKWLAPACGDYIVGVEFAFEDCLLRLQLSKGHVVYLGEPGNRDRDTFTYWQHAIHQVYLDTATVPLKTPFDESPTNSIHPHHLRLFPQAGTTTTIPFIIHPNNSSPFLYYTGTYHPPSSSSSSSSTTTTTATSPSNHLTLTGALPTQWSPLIPRACFNRLPTSFPRAGTRDARTVLSRCGRLLALWDPDATTAARPSGRVHVCRWPDVGTATAMATGKKEEGAAVGTVWGVPSLVGRAVGRAMGLVVEEVVGEDAGEGKREGEGEERYRVEVRTDEEVVAWEVRLPALAE
ncbi:MAG: hypothetical protein M1822_007890 [Bathelium mastoideum]|nr:MAG: hypothetical protein M1822_007890 [Bathelium mastoideum]